MTYDLTNLRKSLSFVGSFKNGCMDCIGSPYSYGGMMFSCGSPDESEVRGIIRELQILGLDLNEVDGRCHTSLARVRIGVCITPERFCEAVEGLLRTKES